MTLYGEAKRFYDREWMRKRRAEWFAGKVCAECGTTEELELDHIDPTEKVTHAVWSWSYDRRMKELDKCQALCRTCHMQKTIGERRKTHCLRGHSLEDADRTKTGAVIECRTCRNERFRRKRAEARQ